MASGRCGCRQGARHRGTIARGRPVRRGARERPVLPIDVIQIQLKALKDNDTPKADAGIKQTWLFAHPKNKLVTGPYPRFRIMLYDPHYQILLNHKSHSINLIQSDDKKFVYGVNVVSKDNQNFFYEWHIEKGTEENCNNCWFTSAVSYPQPPTQALKI